VYSIAVDDERVLQLDGMKTPAQLIQEWCTKNQASVTFDTVVEDVEDDSKPEKKRFKVTTRIGDISAEVSQRLIVMLISFAE
jgi:hypothetical protein